MAFGDGILQCLGLKNELSRCPFRVTLFGCEGAVIGGVKKIAKISDDDRRRQILKNNLLRRERNGGFRRGYRNSHLRFRSQIRNAMHRLKRRAVR